MLNFFQFDTDENRKSLLKRARKIAILSLLQYDLEWENIQFIQLSDTITYKIGTSSKENFLLRIHSDKLDKEEIQSELTLLNVLNKSDDLTVPEGLMSRDGFYILEVDTDAGYLRPCVTIMRWVEGEHAKEEFTDSCIYKMGVLMGRLHEVAASFSPPPGFVRPIWGADSFRLEMAKLERHYTRFLSEKSWGMYQSAAKKVLSELAVIPKNDDNYGLIHADLHTGNLVFKDGYPYPIDFGRCGYGYYLYDIAGTLLELMPKNRQMFIQGYESVRKLEINYVRYLECFFIMFMIENYCHHASDPRETIGLIDEQKYAQAYIRNYLNNTPFLFEMIQPVKIE
ncbi:homoserine kinase [Bacillus sp. J14TS2]|uniref:phosphotransferase enzyme family protein n=1 Tax=Bacillus sp. J14TS2 TaxID=2807188 RepID=UPI001B29EF56|nr:phosphotransferase [Bacillus sp. J14TS2]GIN71903.1 homoserine kinase [Bacillus sp. J14TS2]